MYIRRDTRRHAGRATTAPQRAGELASWRARDLASGDAKLPSNTKLGHLNVWVNTYIVQFAISSTVQLAG
uniref:SFRICE_023931 n=1 Tax=Spodoptera frugiperda TaxID=7108 RepID=A0A2H1VUV4_SPOFR